MKKLNEKINVVALCFAIVFSGVLIVRWSALEVVDIAFYGLAILGFVVMCIAPLFSKKPEN